MNIKIEKTDKALSVNGGLPLLEKLLQRTELDAQILPHLPQMKIAKPRIISKFHGLFFGFVAGAECLDDLNDLSKDIGFKSVNKRTFSATTYGDYLRSFSKADLKGLSKSLINLSFQLREWLYPNQESITIDIDSTPNKQYAKKMEGVAVNYKGTECLDTIKAFDEHGLQYWLDVRAGNTHTSIGAPEIIHQIFSQMPKTKKYKNITRYVRGDSGYCNAGFFNACEAKDVKFVTSMRGNMLEPLIQNVRRWKPIKESRKESIRFYDGRTCEVGQTTYKTENIHKPLRVLIIRAKKKPEEGMLIKENEYDYYGWVSNIDEHLMSKEKLIQFYRKRGQAENYIKDMKYGFDLKHYPCQKLIANKAYGLICAYAYTFMRFIALKSSKGKTHYVKRIRQRLINVPAHIVCHARQVVFKYSEHHYKEVERFLQLILKLKIGFT